MEPSLSDNLVTESVSTEWTDEKHRLYLKSMETSFVDQLYESMDFLGFRPTHSRKKYLSTHAPSEQIKVLRNGRWQRINFERAADPQVKKADGSGDFLANPWIQHFRPRCTSHVVASSYSRQNAASTSHALDLTSYKAASCGSPTCKAKQICAGHSYQGHESLVVNDAEFSDQNFVDEEVEGEKESQIHDAKRKKSCVTDASSDDRVVPHHKSPIPEDITKDEGLNGLTTSL